MVDEVIAGERVDQVAVTSEMGRRDRYELTVPSRLRHRPGPSQEGVSVGSEQGGRDQDLRVVAGS